MSVVPLRGAASSCDSPRAEQGRGNPGFRFPRTATNPMRARRGRYAGRVSFIGLCAVLLALDSPAAREWNAQRTPAPGAPRAIGAFSGGCLQGAATLPASGPGYEALRLEPEPPLRTPGADRVRAPARRGGQARQARAGGDRRSVAAARRADAERPPQPPVGPGRRHRLRGAGGDAGRPAVVGRPRAALAPGGGRSPHARRDARLRVPGPSPCSPWPRRSGGGSHLRQPGGQADALRRAHPRGALAGAPPPLVGAPRPLPRPPQVPRRQPGMHAPGSAPRRRLRRLARLVVHLRRGGDPVAAQAGRRGRGGAEAPGSLCGAARAGGPRPAAHPVGAEAAAAGSAGARGAPPTGAEAPPAGSVSARASPPAGPPARPGP